MDMEPTVIDHRRGILLRGRWIHPQHFFPVICGASGRKELDLRGAILVEFPEDILRLTEVEDLNLDDSPIPNIRGTEDELLKMLDDGPVRIIASIPKTIQRLSNIIRLSLTGLGLHEFPAAVAGLPKLEYLDLSWNLHMSFPPAICPQLKRLKTLILQGRIFDSVPSDFSELLQLEHLDVRDNELGVLIATSGLINLNYLAIDGDKLADFIDQAPSNVCRNIRTIDIRGLVTESSITSHLTRLQSLDTLYIYTVLDVNYYPLICHHLVKAAKNSRQNLPLPPSEVVRGGQDAVDAYYSSLEETSASRQKRVKVLVNGKSMAGKTSLVNALEEVLTQCKRKNRSKIGRRKSCLTEVEDRTVSVEQRQLRLGDVDVKLLDTGGQKAYELTNQVVTSNNSLIVTVIDSSQYEMTPEKFHCHVGKYLQISFDLLFQALILLVMTKTDKSGKERLQAFAEHIQHLVREFIEERKASRRTEVGRTKQAIKVHPRQVPSRW